MSKSCNIISENPDIIMEVLLALLAHHMPQHDASLLRIAFAAASLVGLTPGLHYDSQVAPAPSLPQQLAPGAAVARLPQAPCA